MSTQTSSPPHGTIAPFDASMDRYDVSTCSPESSTEGTRFWLDKTAFEQGRKRATIVFVVLVLSCSLVCRSYWDTTSMLGNTMFLVGVVLTTAGGFGRLWSNVFIAGYKSRELITVGPYSLCRNPLYFFSALGMAGIAITSGMLLIFCVIAAIFFLYYRAIIAAEEGRLRQIHGKEYDDYCACTPVFWPRYKNSNLPEEYTVHPRDLRRCVLDASLFVVLMGLVHTISHLHESGILPSWFYLP